VALARLLLADDNAGVLAYLHARLAKMFDIVAAFENGKLAVDGVLRLDPDVAILDISMPVMNGFQAMARLRDAKCRTKIVILTTYEDADFISKAFLSGANAYVYKRCLADDLEAAIRAVLCGKIFISPSIALPAV
jgi:DNA-binding NarL/FixJ family response regulator